MADAEPVQDAVARADAAIAALEREIDTFEHNLATWDTTPDGPLDGRCELDAGSARSEVPEDVRAPAEGWVDRFACATAVATFWQRFDFSAIAGGHSASVSIDPRSVVGEPGDSGAIPAQPPCQASEASGTESASELSQRIDPEDLGDVKSAMRAALAAAEAELAAQDSALSPASSATRPHPPGSAGPPAPAQKFAFDLLDDPPAGDAEAKDESVEPLPNLDDETARRLRLLRRMNPGRSQHELLARIRSERPPDTTRKGKKGWLGRR